MKTEGLVRAAGRTALAALAMLHLTCNQAIMTAPPGSSLSCFANPEFIATNGDTSVISALVVEPAGTVVADGTVVQFFTNLGHIQEQGKTNDGVARVNLISDTRSGTATITAVSGGGAPATNPSGTPTPAPTPTPAGRAAGVTAAGTGAIAAVGATADASATCSVVIGSARPKTIIIVADPPRITGSGPARQSRIAATVFDEFGNVVVHVPVIFTITEPTGADATENMASGGTPVYTDTNGQAIDFLQTRYPADADPKVVQVTATVPVGATAVSVSVQIN
jgi:hypothetical protein